MIEFGLAEIAQIFNQKINIVFYQENIKLY